MYSVSVDKTDTCLLLKQAPWFYVSCIKKNYDGRLCAASCFKILVVKSCIRYFEYSICLQIILHFLKIRMSNEEPINVIYLESLSC